MFESIMNFFKRVGPKQQLEDKSKNMAKERLHLVLMQDRANVSADFLDMMRQEIIEVIKKYIDVNEKDIDVRLTNKPNEDGTIGAPALYANIPIAGIKENIIIDKETEISDKTDAEAEPQETEKIQETEEVQEVEKTNEETEEIEAEQVKTEVAEDQETVEDVEKVTDTAEKNEVEDKVEATKVEDDKEVKTNNDNKKVDKKKKTNNSKNKTNNKPKEK